MSNSERAKQRRLRRSRLSAGQRKIRERQHWGDAVGKRKKRLGQRESDISLARRLGFGGIS